jgi:hypothetical protein
VFPRQETLLAANGKIGVSGNSRMLQRGLDEGRFDHALLKLVPMS